MSSTRMPILSLVFCLITDAVSAECSIPASPPHGHRYVLKGGKTILFRCSSGYELQGASTITCLHSEWSHVIPKCIPVTSGKLTV